MNFECKNLSLKFGEKILFSDFNFGFLGPGIVMIEGDNGTGKSTLLKLFAGFVLAKNGEIHFSGLTASEIPIKSFSFFTTSSLGLLSDLTGREHIDLVSKFMKLDLDFAEDKIREFQEMEIFNEILNKRVIDFSQGMKHFLRLFLHLFFEPKVVFLDEPFLYLSPTLKEFIQHKVESMAAKALVFVTDQSFSWDPKIKNEKIFLGLK